MVIIFSKRNIFHGIPLFFLIALIVSGCAPTIPEGKEYVLLSNAKVTPDVISSDGSSITVEYKKTAPLQSGKKFLIGYFISPKGLEKRPGGLGGGGVTCYLLLSSLNANLANERGTIRFPITNIFDRLSKDWLSKYKIYGMIGNMHNAEFVQYVKPEDLKYIGNTTISIFLSIDEGERISNVLIVPVSFK
jgi:hypothetical protein